MNTEPGSFIGPYKILGALGRGGMGSVLRALDTRLHREVALKMLNDDLSMPGMHERFLREARAASSLNHPNICTIFDIGDHEGAPYMVMEVMAGETLRDRIDRGALPVSEVLAFGMEIADALAAAHAKGIIHRDIKPANIFLVPRPNGSSQAKVLDFGLAKIEKGHGDSRHSMDLTVSGSTVGTVSYMSPEQARGEPLDARSDLFSLGVMLYEMATGQVPFGGNTSAIIFVNILSHDPPSMRGLNNLVPKDLEKVILKLLEKDRKDRFQSSTDLLIALAKITDKKSLGWLGKSGSKSDDPEPSYPKPVDRKLRRPSSPAVAGGRRGGDLPARMSRPFTPPASPAKPASNPFEATAEISVPAAGWNPPQSKSRELEASARPEDKTSAVAVASSGIKAAQTFPEIRKTDVYSNAVEAAEQKPKSKKGLLAAVAVVVLSAAGYFAYTKLHSNKVSSPALDSDRPLLITTIQNQTGDATLNDWIESGLAMELSQSSEIRFRGPQAFRARLAAMGVEVASVDSAKIQQAAQQAGAPVFVSGSIKAAGAMYPITVALTETETGKVLATFNETAASKERIGVTLDRIGQQLREALGESNADITKNSVPFNSLATSSQDALKQFAQGEVLFNQSEPLPAIREYEQAVAADSTFVQPQIKLAIAYEVAGADDSAAAAAKAAMSAAAKSGSRVAALAAIANEIYGTGNLNKALELLKAFSTAFPHDVDGFRLQAVTFRKLGRWQDAAQAAQQGLDQNANDGNLVRETELAMIGQNRYEAALEQERVGAKEGLHHGGNQLLAAYLQHKSDLLDSQIAEAKAHPDQTALTVAYATYLDNAGKLHEGLAAWKQAAGSATSHPALGSAAALYLGRAALDRAVLNDCSEALSTAKSAPAKRSASAHFNLGTALALCGDSSGATEALNALRSGYSQDTAVQEYMIPILTAAMQWKAGQSAAVLDTLSKAKEFDAISIAPYLRGLAQVGVGKSQVALVDHQILLQHRGAAIISSGSIYPAAQIGLAHAYDAMGDKNNASQAYKAFAKLWEDADPGSPLLAEAKAKGR